MSRDRHPLPRRRARTGPGPLLTTLLALSAVAAMVPAQAQPFTRTIDTTVEVRRSSPWFGFYSLPASESLHITAQGELNAPTQSTGAGIGLAGRVLNEGRLRAGFGSEVMGLGVGGALYNAEATATRAAGLIEAVMLGAESGARIENFGDLYTGSHTFPTGNGAFAGLRVAFLTNGAAMGGTGFAIAEGGRIENGGSGVWTSHAHGTVLGELINAGTFSSENSFDTAPATPGGGAYFKLIRVGQDWLDAPIGRIANGGSFSLDASTQLLNAGTFDNSGVLRLDGLLEVQRLGRFRQQASGLTQAYGVLEVGLYSPPGGGLVNQGQLLVDRGGQLIIHGQAVNEAGGVIRLAPAVPSPGGGFISLAGRAVLDDNGSLQNAGRLEVQGSFTGNGNIDNVGGQVVVGAGGRLAVMTLVGGRVDNDGGHVDIGRDALLAVDAFSQTSGRLTVNGSLTMAPGAELRILGGVLDGGGVLDPLTGQVTGGGLINGRVFLSGAGGGPAQQPPFCGATGWACFRPGNSPGAVQIDGDLTLGDHAVLQLEVERDAGGQLLWDTVLATNMHFGAGSVIELTLGAGVGDTGALPLDLLRCAQTCTFEGSFTVLGGRGDFFADGSGLHFSGVSGVPEPTPAALLLAGALALHLRARRRREGVPA